MCCIFCVFLDVGLSIGVLLESSPASSVVSFDPMSCGMMSGSPPASRCIWGVTILFFMARSRRTAAIANQPGLLGLVISADKFEDSLHGVVGACLASSSVLAVVAKTRLFAR